MTTPSGAHAARSAADISSLRTTSTWHSLASEVGVQVAAAAADNAERGEHAQGGPRPGRRGDCCLAQRGAERADQRGRLDQALAVLRGGIRARGDAAAAAEPYPPVVKLEGADGDVQLEPGDGAAVADRARIDLP